MERKTPQIPPVKMMERKVLSLGMKLGLSYVNYKDKLLGEQVAYVIDDMLNAVEQGKNTIESIYYIILRIKNPKLDCQKAKRTIMDVKKNVIRKRKKTKVKKIRTLKTKEIDNWEKVETTWINQIIEGEEKTEKTISVKKEEIRYVEISGRPKVKDQIEKRKIRRIKS